ncbi:hypothetical protein [Streptomyces sp. NPDC057695]|uniref:hypothetical protein n=1 Tax=Streptomyces sp. NPDC057695 TaxID=3346217 RepID=UPI0036A06661
MTAALGSGCEIAVLVTESWLISDDSPVPVSSETVPGILRSRIATGQPEAWLTSSSARSPAFVTSTERVMVMRLDEEGGPGEHAVDLCGL